MAIQNSITLSVDVEDGINIAMRDVFGKEMPPTERVVANTERILDLLEGYNAKATFFTLGQVAEYYPDLIKKIHSKGHEIGVHGYDHHRFDKMAPELARSQLSRAKELLEDLTGEEVAGHRAPAFSINEQTKWALPLLAELGFRYDSSIMPCRAAHYGWPGFPDDVTEIHFSDGNSIYEIPMSTMRLGSRKVPCLGGSYFRLLPYRISQYSIDKISKRNTPVFYMHPYETDPERYPDYYFDELNKVSTVLRLKMKSMWIGRKNFPDKMEKMLRQNETMTMVETS
ncbi:polysaccharide deacetylase family protein [Rhodohalobacter sp.]|uniref:polysaccharide deacetylase family protein n=1 Tax=Rhodohalobacter sp. TaxID=1974210 RepID=UPI002ACEA222|nr:polysaccharide deacetylase family protein [Rhodohalobacter sp.]MDZ7755208.1 polysaccharide deacetylase family protein [Rhodohalobacter sp.]